MRRIFSSISSSSHTNQPNLLNQTAQKRGIISRKLFSFAKFTSSALDCKIAFSKEIMIDGRKFSSSPGKGGDVFAGSNLATDASSNTALPPSHSHRPSTLDLPPPPKPLEPDIEELHRQACAKSQRTYIDPKVNIYMISRHIILAII